ncbi:DNA repair metallo-beta-lactamase family protein [Melia azedarach]|uniref:DNA repair metallo-beta-lactamase family protein n=1 Tax=Melia azedarach TaxID=155640 RepID=A0ACC1XV54_MELAZ|nr:DNA repair metallo-beta-lactamase family protein [Melia azedarach]
MPIEMPKGLPLSVDTFSPASKKKRHHFLTHAHRDHTVGISSHFQYPIYSTRLTKSLILQHYSQLDESFFVGIEVGQTIVVDDPDGEFRVTAFDANHCPGSVMFLFEGHFGNILHTGDCSLTPECLQNLPEKYIGKKGKAPRCQLDYLFLDCTFGKFSQKLPSKHSAIRQVISCIWKHPDVPVVYLTCDLLGQEEILAAVSKTFGSKIFVDKASNPECFQSLMLTAPEILSEDPSSRYRMFDGFPKLYERASAKFAEAQANFQPEPLIIRPSAQWYACEQDEDETPNQRKLRFNEAVRDQFGVWHVCYSMHSSREELEWALELLAPKRVVSTTPTCRAMELDYVRKHCFSRITSDDPIWKLLDISVKTSAKLDVSEKVEDCASLLLEEPTQTSAESKLQPVERSSVMKELFSLPPPGKRLPVTLFGRARHGLADFSFSCEEKKKESMKQITVDKTEQKFSAQEVDAAVNCKNNFEKLGKLLEKDVNRSSSQVRSSCEEKTKESMKDDPQQIIVNKTEQQFSSLEMDAEVRLVRKEFESSFHSPISSSKNFNESLRKLYRSKNVPVPRPLPSLVELMNANKRTKRRFEFYS